MASSENEGGEEPARTRGPTAPETPRAGAPGQARPVAVVVMGVAGAGKTTVGRALANSLGWPFFDADDFHSPANVAKMRAGTPLTDADRAPWLASLRALIARHLDAGTPLVLACSALRAAYRDALRPAGAPAAAVAFVQLDVAPEVAARRLAVRRGHYMPASLVASQFATLEEPRDALRLDAARPVAELVQGIVGALEIRRAGGLPAEHQG